jgi:uncharacterized membrane protein YfcA
MFAEIGRYLSENGLAIVLIFTLWFLLFDEKAIDRIRKSKMKNWVYVPIFGFLFQIVLGIIGIIKKY